MLKIETVMSEDYEVGYGKPPKSSKFKSGRSGNPKGRPKGHLNLKTDLTSVLKAPVSVNEGGKKRSVTTQHALLMRLREQALNGDQKAIEKLIGLAMGIGLESTEEQSIITESDQAIIERYSTRRAKSASKPKPSRTKRPNKKRGSNVGRSKKAS